MVASGSSSSSDRDEDDEALLAAWQAGDRQSGARLYQRHYRTMDRFFRNKVPEPEDLIQRAFVACLEAPSKFRKDSKFQTYLIGIALNQLRKHYRENARHKKHAALEDRSVEEMGQTPSQIVAKHELDRLLLEALRNLPVDHQITLELYYWEDLTAREIAEVLAQPEGTVRDRIRRAKKLLETFMREQGESGEQLRDTVTKLHDWAERVRKKKREDDDA